MRIYNRYIYARTLIPRVVSVLFFFVLFLSACSTRRTTPISRFYHSWTTRYNTLFNAKALHQDAYDQQISRVLDDYDARTIAPDPVAYLIMRKERNAQWDRVIDKCRKAIELHSLRPKPHPHIGSGLDRNIVLSQSKREYNDAMSSVWLLLIDAYMYSGHVEEAEATIHEVMALFASDPIVYTRALLSHVRLTTMLGHIGESQMLLNELDTTRRVLSPLRDYYHLTLAEYYLRVEDDVLAQHHLSEAILSTRHKDLRARLHFVLAQLSVESGGRLRGVKHYRNARRLTASPTLAYEAELREIIYTGAPPKVQIKQLKDLLRSVQHNVSPSRVYYALSRSYLSSADTIHALRMLQTSADSAGVDRSVRFRAYSMMAELYLHRREWARSADAYGSALSALDSTQHAYSLTLRMNRALTALTHTYMASSDSLEYALYERGRIYYEQLDLLDLARTSWQALIDTYPDGRWYPTTLYRLMLLEHRLGYSDKAEQLRAQYLRRYNASPLGKILSQPDYLLRLARGEHEPHPKPQVLLPDIDWLRAYTDAPDTINISTAASTKTDPYATRTIYIGIRPRLASVEDAHFALTSYSFVAFTNEDLCIELISDSPDLHVFSITGFSSSNVTKRYAEDVIHHPEISHIKPVHLVSYLHQLP